MLDDRLRWICLLTLLLANLQAPSLYAAQPTLSEDAWSVERSQYTDALQALAKGKTRRFKQLKAQLTEYPLYPYLEYGYLRVQIKRHTPSQSVTDFFTRYEDTPLFLQLKHHWLRTLAKRGQWQHYLEFYDERVKSVELKCYALWAEFKTRDAAEALSKVEPIWLVGHSQPNACEPIFKVWSENHLSDELVWQRFSLAMNAGKTQLARYLIRFMSTKLQKQAKFYREIHFYPERISSRNFVELDPKNEEILLHGMKRLAWRDPILAQALWEEFSRKFNFIEAIHQQIEHRILLGLAKQNQSDAFAAALASFLYPDDTALIKAGIEMNIRHQRWPEVIRLINTLPLPTQQMAQWQYWYARAAQFVTPSIKEIDSVAIYQRLAESRDYYGFLAADHLNTSYQLNAISYPENTDVLKQIKSIEGVKRAKELFLLGNTTEARREWSWASRHFNAEQHYMAAHYAHSLGWHSQAIRSTIEAEKWHDLKLRFPLAYQEKLLDASKENQLDVNWLLALARQESAMTSDVQSPKGARGLMQIMPSTARMISKKHQISYHSSHDLLDPAKNIELASAYLKDLLTQFNENSIYATAAYNAGPHRVNKWLKESSNQPLDIWIENIPYAETRQYVKNVLAYSVIFATLRKEMDFRMATNPYLSNLAPQLAATKTETE